MQIQSMATKFRWLPLYFRTRLMWQAFCDDPDGVLNVLDHAPRSLRCRHPVPRELLEVLRRSSSQLH